MWSEQQLALAGDVVLVEGVGQMELLNQTSPIAFEEWPVGRNNVTV